MYAEYADDVALLKNIPTHGILHILEQAAGGDGIYMSTIKQNLRGAYNKFPDIFRMGI